MREGHGQEDSRLLGLVMIGVIDQSVYLSKNTRNHPAGPVGALGAELVDALSADVLQALDAVQFPAFVVDRDRRVRWQNAAAIQLVGDLRGKVDRSFLAPEDLARVRDAWARKQMGALHTEYEATLLRGSARRWRFFPRAVRRPRWPS